MAVAEAILDRGGASLSDGAGPSVLSCAIVNEQVDMVRFLLERGASTEHSDDPSVPPLVLACMSAASSPRSADLALLLLVHGANPSHCSRSQIYPVHAAHDCPRVLRELIRRGVDVNVKNRFGKTPLQFALENKVPASIALLRQAGAEEPPQAACVVG